MNQVEKLNKYFQDHDNETVQDYELKDRLETLERDIRRSWDEYKLYQLNMHGFEVRTSALRMALLYLIRKGIL